MAAGQHEDVGVRGGRQQRLHHLWRRYHRCSRVPSRQLQRLRRTGLGINLHHGPGLNSSGCGCPHAPSFFAPQWEAAKTPEHQHCLTRLAGARVSIKEPKSRFELSSGTAGTGALRKLTLRWGRAAAAAAAGRRQQQQGGGGNSRRRQQHLQGRCKQQRVDVAADSRTPLPRQMPVSAPKHEIRLWSR